MFTPVGDTAVSGEIIDPLERPIIVSRSASVDRRDDNDNLLVLMPPSIRDSTKQVPQLESWESKEMRTNEGDREGTAGSDIDKTVLTEDIRDLSDYNNPKDQTEKMDNINIIHPRRSW